MQIKDLCVHENKTLKEAMNIIDKGGLRIAFVVDNVNRFLGVVTTGDIRKAILNGSNLETYVKKIMNISPLTIEEGWGEKEIIEFLKKEDVSKLIKEKINMKIPVLDKDKKIVKIIIANCEGYEPYIVKKEETKDNITLIKPVNKVLIVGGAGFLGSILCKKLLDKKYKVKVLDNLTYGNKGIKELYKEKNFEFIQGDMRDIQAVVKAIWDVDAVIHLAAIVGDPASALNPIKTIEINYFATKMLAEICKYSQINRFIFASTCSVYGASKNPNKKLSENSELSPVSLYAEMKLRSEEGILELADENFSPTILRMATLHGLSPRMRFDLVVNTLTIAALKKGKISIFGGQQWRPNLHVSDAADAYIKCLEEPLSKINGQIFNVGSNEENYKIIQIGKKIKQMIPESEMKIDDKNVDERNYNVSFDKIYSELKFLTSHSIEDSVKEIKGEVNKGKFEDFADKKYNNFKFLRDQKEEYNGILGDSE